MGSDEEHQQYQNIQQEIRAGRRFSLAEAIGREGSGFMKGDSPVPKLVQARTELCYFISKHLSDRSGALQAVLISWIQSDEVQISRHLDTPLLALSAIIQSITHNPHMLYEFVRQVDVKWGEMNNERPYFQRPGQAPHPDDEYTHASVHEALTHFLHTIES